MNSGYFQIQLGKDLKDVGLHVEWDPVTGEQLTGGACNPEGIKIETCQRTRRVASLVTVTIRAELSSTSDLVGLS